MLNVISGFYKTDVDESALMGTSYFQASLPSKHCMLSLLYSSEEHSKENY